jgi:hypothetical protein
MNINEDAPVITRDEILIDAPIETIWSVQTDVDAWPSWQPDVDDADADGPLTAQVETLRGALDASLRAWLENLKRTAEGRSKPR